MSPIFGIPLCLLSFSLFHTPIKPPPRSPRKIGGGIDLIIHLGFQTAKKEDGGGKALLPRLSFDARKLKFIGVHFPKKKREKKLNFLERVATFTWE